MKLTYPTDEQLNYTFAELICGFRWFSEPKKLGKFCNSYLIKGQPPDDWTEGIAYGKDRLSYDGPWFTGSADEVLPWLEKAGRGEFMHSYDEGWHRVTIARSEFPDWEGEAKTFARAATIAVLRAHGVEIVHAP